MSDATEKPAKPSYVEPIVIRLRTPIKHGSRTVEELTVRPVKAKYMRTLKDSDSSLERTFQMAAKLTGEIKEVIDELEGPDLRDLLEHVNGFLFAIQGTGP